MIVADTNIISYLFLPTDYTDKVSQLYRNEPEWIAPELWRSEFRNVLALYLRQQAITLADALIMMEEAEGLMANQEFSPTSVSVLTLVNSSACSAYDCEFVALAKQFGIKLVTQDQKILREFPETAISIDIFLQNHCFDA
jgi:predicted nucleic acid-binding protein